MTAPRSSSSSRCCRACWRAAPRARRSIFRAFAAGKTGTTDDELDAWFVGFTNDVTVAIWVGYDNADGNRRTLGRGQTGGRVALPMFEPILQSVWAVHAPKTALNGPSKEAMRELVAVRIDAYTGDTDEYGDPRRAQGGTIEYMKRSASGGVADTRYKIVSGGQNYAYRRGDGFDEDGTPMQQQRSAVRRLRRLLRRSAQSTITAAAPSRIGKAFRTMTIPSARRAGSIRIISLANDGIERIA